MKFTVTPASVLTAFAVGSSVYFWYQFAALKAVEQQVSGTLASVGLDQVLSPSASVQRVQDQAPIMAVTAALATLAVAGLSRRA